MKRWILASVLTVTALALPTLPAVANEGEEHNCAGQVSSTLAQVLPPPLFGQIVAGAAQDQIVDNFGFANCGETPRQNP